MSGRCSMEVHVQWTTAWLFVLQLWVTALHCAEEPVGCCLFEAGLRRGSCLFHDGCHHEGRAPSRRRYVKPRKKSAAESNHKNILEHIRIWFCSGMAQRAVGSFEYLSHWSIAPMPMQYILDRICCLDVIIPTCMVFFEIPGWQILGVIIESRGCFQLVMLLAFEVVLLQVPRLPQEIKYSRAGCTPDSKFKIQQDKSCRTCTWWKWWYLLSSVSSIISKLSLGDALCKDILIQCLGLKLEECFLILWYRCWVGNSLQHVTTCYNMLQHVTTWWVSFVLRYSLGDVDLLTCWPVFPTVRSFLPRHAMLFEKTGIQARCCHPVVSMSFNVGCHEVPPSPHPLTCLSYLVSWLVLAFMLAGALVHSGLLFNPWLQHHFAAWWINVLSSPEF